MYTSHSGYNCQNFKKTFLSKDFLAMHNKKKSYMGSRHWKLANVMDLEAHLNYYLRKRTIKDYMERIYVWDRVKTAQ